ncbi:hypothetical protein JCM12294_16460 [Desulfocicer niacini]
MDSKNSTFYPMRMDSKNSYQHPAQRLLSIDSFEHANHQCYATPGILFQVGGILRHPRMIMLQGTAPAGETG